MSKMLVVVLNAYIHAQIIKQRPYAELLNLATSWPKQITRYSQKFA
jgi:hypothetical protein